MEITLEKIELVKDRTGVTYKEAKEALEAADGNVVDAIIEIEEKVDSGESRSTKAKKDALVAKMKDIVKKGNVSRIMITRDGDTILNIPLTAGLLGSIVAPYGMIAGAVAAFGFKCKIEFIRDDGSVIDISEKAENLYEDTKVKGAALYGDIKEKAPGVYEDVKEKSGAALSKAKEAAMAAKEKIKREKDVFEDEIEDYFDDADIEDLEDVFEKGADDADTEKTEERETGKEE
jgi:hypothetical protein